jgi:hypothetical protein
MKEDGMLRENSTGRPLVLAVSLALGLTLASSIWAAAPQDSLLLKDGRVIHGQVVEETDAKVTVMVAGVQRRYGRDLIKRIDYGGSQPLLDGAGDPEQPATSRPAEPRDRGAEAIPAPAPEPSTRANSLDEDLALRYQVPLSEVHWIRAQGIVDADLPLVLFVAARARIAPGPVVSLRLKGWTWSQIEDRYGIDGRQVYFVGGPWVPYPMFRIGWGWGGGWGGGWGRHGRR